MKQTDFCKSFLAADDLTKELIVFLLSLKPENQESLMPVLDDWMANDKTAQGLKDRLATVYF